MADNTKTAKMWQEAASATAECLPLEVLERMTENVSAEPKAAAHLAGCAHCQTELAMLKNFEQSTPSADEGAAVAWIAAQLERRQSAPVAEQKIARVPFWRTMFRVPYLAGAAALAAVLVLGISLYHGSSEGPGRINPGLGSGQFRGSIHLVSPIAEQDSAPAEFRWDAVQGAESYSRRYARHRNHQAELPAGKPRYESRHDFRQAAQVESNRAGREWKRDRQFEPGAIQGEVVVC
jgi:hypothetical protein